nr:MAG TPA: RecT protein [Caudoviricetes sp.]
MDEIKNEVAIQSAELPVQKSKHMLEYEETLRIGKGYSMSGIVPSSYANKPFDCAIAVDMANRLGVPPLMVMQQLFVVKGKPVWSGQACMTFIRNRFDDVDVVYTGERGTDTYGCYISAMDGDKKIQGTEITIAMAKAEGWMQNTKWRNMPQQMLAYRAASFFARVYCPNTLMGCQVEGEVEDCEPQRRKAVDVL